MSKITAYTAAFDDKSAPARQADAANQRESWLRQMELAQLNGMTSSAGKPRAAPAAMQPPPSALRPMPQARQGAAHDSAESARQERRDAPQDDSGAPPDLHAPAVQATTQAAAQAAMQAPPAQAVSAAPPEVAATAGAATAPQLISGPQNAPAAVAGALARGPLAAATPAASATLMPAMATAAPGAIVGAGAGQAVLRSLVRPGLTMPAGEGAAPNLESAPEPAAPEAAPLPEHQQPLAEKPVWQKRMMHLTGSGQEVDVWIRDSALDAQQSAGLVARLAGDMAGAGLRLKGVTVNGKAAAHSDAQPAPPSFWAGADVPPETPQEAYPQAHPQAQLRAQAAARPHAPTTTDLPPGEVHGTR